MCFGRLVPGARLNVRYWPIADMPSCTAHFRFIAFAPRNVHLYAKVMRVESMANRLRCLARSHSFRRCPVRNSRRRKDCEISVAARESIEADLAVSYRSKLTAQKFWRGTMPGRRPVGVDNADTRTRLKRGNEIVEQAVGLGDFVIHVHQNCDVD